MEKMTYLKTRLENLFEIVSLPLNHYIQSELKDFLIEVFMTVKENIRDLDAILDAALKKGKFDFEDIKAILSLLKNADLKNAVFQFPNQKEIKAEEILEKLDALFSNLIEQEAELDNLEVNLRLEMAGDSLFSKLLWVLRDAFFINFLKPIIKKKISFLTPESLRTLWIWIKQESGFEEDKIIRVAKGVVPENFFDAEDDETIKDHIVEYLINIKPNTIRERIAEGHNLKIPMKIPGLAKILTWSDVATIRQNTTQENLLIRCLGVIIYFWESYLNEELSTLQNFLNVNLKDKRIFGLDSFEKGALEENKDRHQQYFHYELKNLILIIEELAPKPIELGSILEHYKYKLELTKGATIADLKNKHEKEIQNDFRSFLLDRGIFAFGKQFGDKEIDAVVPEGLDKLAIEIAIFRIDNKINATLIRNKLQQLQSYTEEFPQISKGVLLIYNLTDKRIQPQRSWIRGQYLITAVNLGKSPSKAKGVIEISEGKKALIEFKTTRSSKKKSRKKQ